MSEEMKLLEALCKALGFTVVTTVDYEERLETQAQSAPLRDYYTGNASTRKLKSHGGKYIIIDSMYTSMLKEPKRSYEVRKMK